MEEFLQSFRKENTEKTETHQNDFSSASTDKSDNALADIRSIWNSDVWKNNNMAMPLAVGKDTSGNPVVFDLAMAQHLLVAGENETEVRECIDTIVASLLLKSSPVDLKLVLVGSSVTSFDHYKTIPHLLAPIICDSGKILNALQRIHNEMEQRYIQMFAAGARNIAQYNRRQINGEQISDHLPHIVVIVSELGDLMMTGAGKDAEKLITRIAIFGRTTGIHLILATRRPSTKIITGVIKGNLPWRFCFQVRSVIDSRVVLDASGAEKLSGRGDMLMTSLTSLNIEHVKGAFVDDKDIKEIVKFVSDQAPQNFNNNILIEEDPVAGNDNDEVEDGVSPFDDDDVFDEMDRANIAPFMKKYLQPGDDENFKRALEIVILDRNASTSYLQRRLRIGYNTAANITRKLEDRGIIGPDTGSGRKRDILI